MFSFFKNRILLKNASDSLFIKLNEYARNPNYFGENLVEDSPDGRFEMVALFATAIFIGLSKRGEFEKNLAQKLFDKIFKTFDQALRELGVSDVKVGDRIKKMAESYYGRQKSYVSAFESDDSDELEKKIALNVFGRDNQILEIDKILATEFNKLSQEIRELSFDTPN